LLEANRTQFEKPFIRVPNRITRGKGVPRIKCLLLVFFSATLLLSSFEISHEFTITASIIRVPADYPTIQAGINAASPGDTVQVAAGTYYEHININKSIALIGDNRNSIIDGQQKAPVIVNITVSSVRFEGFTVQNGNLYSAVWAELPYPRTLSNVVITNNIIKGNYLGLFISRSSQFSITNNVFLNNQYGIRTYASSFNTIAGNTVNSSLYNGIYIYTGSENNNIENNILGKNRFGILIEWANRNNVTLNKISESTTYGLRLSFSNYTLVKGNNIEKGTNYGIVLWQSMNNNIYYNNFIQNNVQHYHYNTPYTANTWDDNIRPGTKGNYWSDYTGRDDGSGVGRWGEPRVASDGVGDTLVPHLSVDWYPLMHPWTPVPQQNPVALFTFTPENPYQGETVIFNASASYDPDGTIVSYTWNFGDGTPPVIETDPIATHVYMAAGNYTVTLTVKDNENLTGSTSKVITVVPYRLILDLYSQKPDPYSGKGPNQPSDAFEPQENINLTAVVTYNDDPVANKLVTFIVTDPDNSTVTVREDNTDTSGMASVELRLPTDPVFGLYSAFASVEVNEKTTNDTMPFRVGWIIELLSIETVDQNGLPKTNFVKGEHVLFKVRLQNISFRPRNVTLTITLEDETNSTIGWTSYEVEVPPGYEELNLLFNVQIPYWSVVGNAKAYASALTKYPGGRPYCPEVSTYFAVFRG